MIIPYWWVWGICVLYVWVCLLGLAKVKVVGGSGLRGSGGSVARDFRVQGQGVQGSQFMVLG